MKLHTALLRPLALGLGAALLLLAVGAGTLDYRQRLDAALATRLAGHADRLALLFARGNAEALRLCAEMALTDPALVYVDVHAPTLDQSFRLQRPHAVAGEIEELDRVLDRSSARLRIGVAVAPIAAEVRRASLPLLLALVGQALLGWLLAAALLRHQVLRPLQRVIRHIERLGRGQFEPPIPTAGRDAFAALDTQLELSRQASVDLVRALEQERAGLQAELAERRHTEAALREREARMRALAEQSPLAVIECDAAWNVLEWNPAAEAIFGYRREEVLGRNNLAMLLRPELHEGARRLAAQILKTGRQSAVTHNLRADGQAVICQWHCMLVHSDQSGARFVCLVEDVSERRAHENQFRRLSLVAARSASIIILTNARGQIEWVNDTFVRVTGYSPDEARGRRPGALLQGPATDPETIARLRNAVATATPVSQVEILNYTKGGRPYWVALDIQPIRDDNGRTIEFFSVGNDITTQRLLRETLQCMGRGWQDDEHGYNGLAGQFVEGMGATQVVVAVREPLTAPELRVLGAAGLQAPAAGSRLSLEASPARDALQHGAFHIAREAMRHYPRRPELQAMPVEGLAAAPLTASDGRRFGCFIAYFDHPLSEPDLIAALLQAGAAEIAAQYQRQGCEQALADAHALLREHKQRGDSLLAALPLPVALWRAGQRPQPNAAWSARFGPADDASRDTPLPLADPQQRVALSAALQEADGTAHRFACRRADGSVDRVQLRVLAADLGSGGRWLIAQDEP